MMAAFVSTSRKHEMSGLGLPLLKSAAEVQIETVLTTGA